MNEEDSEWLTEQVSDWSWIEWMNKKTQMSTAKAQIPESRRETSRMGGGARGGPKVEEEEKDEKRRRGGREEPEVKKCQPM